MIEHVLVFDRMLFQWLNGMHHPVADLFFLTVTQLGNGWVLAPLLIGIIAVKIPRKLIVKVLLCGIIGISLSGMVNSQIKKHAGRLRPVAYWQQQQQGLRETQDGGDRYRVHQFGPDYHSRSFPSGHTNTAFSAATFLAVLCGRWFFLAYIGAFLVAYSRIYLGVHFPLDVMFGALIAVGFMAAFMKIFKCDRVHTLKEVYRE